MPAALQLGVGVSVPGISIGINVPAYPALAPVPGYPVYYAPYVDLNYFFYDGMYWVFQGDNWYASSWYNGPWQLLAPDDVPLYILRLPVRFYRHPPAYFRRWHPNTPPHWGEHWGRDWEGRHSGWNRWDRHVVVRPAPLPSYQRHYGGARYPHEPQRQRAIESQRYRYHPNETLPRQHFGHGGEHR